MSKEIWKVVKDYPLYDVSDICNNRPPSFTHKGFKWEYAT
jgi:hypothetical protein